MASLDLKHAYYTIPIAAEHRKYLKFVWGGQLYEFQSLPTGLTSSPRIFTKIMKPVLVSLRQKGYTNSGYIDDFYLQGADFVDCCNNVKDTVDLFLRLGFFIHPEKCILTPTQEITFLGFILNSTTMMAYLSDKKKEKLKFLCTQALDGDILSIRFVARVIGKIVSSLPGSEFGKLHYQNLERDKIRALALNRGDYDAKMQLSVLAKEDLLWWVENVQQAYRRIIHAPITYVFQTDASDTGWGISCPSHDSWKSQGLWSREQGVLHINVRELYVVYICLTIFFSKLSDVHIQFELDNVTAVAYVNQMGGSKSIACDLLAHKIWSLCIARSIWLSSVHIPGCTNVEADLLPRNCYSDHEWQLNRVMFQKLRAVFLALSIDLFASVLNAQLPRYVSWNPDPHATFVDAFSIPWTGEYFYAFPPFSLIHKCLKKIEAEQAEGVLVVPAWTTQTWYPRVLQLLTQAPKLMLWTAGMELVVHPSVHKAHTMKAKLKLIVCPLSGDTMKSEVFRSTLPMYCSTRGDPLLKSNTQFISRNGLYSVVKGKLLHIPLL